MNIGAEIPFRRSRTARKTGSLIFDRQRDDHARNGEHSRVQMRIWNKGHFISA